MSNKKSNKMWGGRFNDQTLPLMEEINSSIDIDKRLALVDIMGSRIFKSTSISGEPIGGRFY